MPVMAYRNWIVRREERGWPLRPRYWALDRAPGRWSTDIDPALVFARRVDAERFIDWCGWKGVAQPVRLETARQEMVP